MKLSIIIISFNTKRILHDCLCSIQNSMKDSLYKEEYEIIVVDNASVDGSSSMIQQDFPNVTLIKNKENVFFATANNQGSSVAHGEYLLLLNSDTIITPGNLEKLIVFLNTHPLPVCMVGPTVLNNDLTFQSCGYSLPSLWERITICFKLFYFLPDFLREWLLPLGSPLRCLKQRQVGWISGCCMMIRRDVYTKIGGLNPLVGFYGEEPELGYRLQQHRFQTWVLPEATIIHLGGASTALGIQRDLEKEEIRIRNYAKLQRLTVGYSQAIRMSKVVVFCAYLKWVFSVGARKIKLANAITHERKVIQYLSELRERKNE